MKQFFKPTAFKVLLAILLFPLPWITFGVYTIDSSLSPSGGIVQENMWRTGFYYFGKILFLPVRILPVPFPFYHIILVLYSYALASVVAFFLPKKKTG